MLEPTRRERIMGKNPLSKLLGGAAALSLALLVPGSPAAAQLSIGGHLTATEWDGGDTEWGFGGRALLQIPLTGFGVQATVDFFNPDCGDGDCDYREIGLHGTWEIPLVVLFHPYVGGGATYQWLEGTDLDELDTDEYEVTLLAGFRLSGPGFERFRPFGEVRYGLKDEELLYSVGLFFSLF